MAEDDEIDVLGDFTFDSLPKNDSNLLSSSSCSDLLQCDYTVHPQWFIDSANWYDNVQTDDILLKKSVNENSEQKVEKPRVTLEWTVQERELLQRGMEIYGRDAKCLSQFISSKSEVEIHLLIEQEFGINLDENATSSGITCNISDINSTFLKHGVLSPDHPTIGEMIPDPVEEVVCINNDSANVKIKKIKSTKSKAPGKNNIVSENVPKVKKIRNTQKCDSPNKLVGESFNNEESSTFSSEVLYYDDDFMVGGTESVVENYENRNNHKVICNTTELHGNKVKNYKNVLHGNNSNKQQKMETYSKYSRRKCKFNKIQIDMAVPSVPQKQMLVSDAKYRTENDSVSTSQMQIITGSGQALSLSKGEQVIKIDKNEDPDSDSEVDIGSDDATVSSQKEYALNPKSTMVKQNQVEFVIDQISGKSDYQPINDNVKQVNGVPFNLRKRKKKLVLDGDGGYTITHSDLGDVYEVGFEPKTHNPQKKQTIGLVHCKSYTKEHPAPYHVVLSTTALLLMDIHAHTSRAEVMGLLGGKYKSELDTLYIEHYAPCDSSENSGTHCDMCPVSQSMAYEDLRSKGCEIVGWFHSHPRFPPHPSAQDITSQVDMQVAFSNGGPITSNVPFVGIIISPYWAPGRTASQYRCLCVERDRTEDENVDIVYKFCVNLNKDMNTDNISDFLKSVSELHAKVKTLSKEFSIDVNKDICPDAKITYLSKCISSIHHHLCSAGYTGNDNVQNLVIKAINDIFS